MKVYIAGPITGHEGYEEKFRGAEEELSSAGHSVMNPARLGSWPEFGWEDYMRVTLEMLAVCDAVLLLPGWEGSRGARLEKKSAQKRGKKIFYSPGDVPGKDAAE